MTKEIDENDSREDNIDLNDDIDELNTIEEYNIETIDEIINENVMNFNNDNIIDETIISILDNDVNLDVDIINKVRVRPIELYNRIEGDNSSDEDDNITKYHEFMNTITDNEDIDEEDNDEIFNNPYVPLDDNDIDDFGEFVESDNTTLGFISSNRNNISTTENELVNDSPVQSSDIPIIPTIKPLTKENIDLIKSIMSNIKLSRRPGLDKVVESIVSSKIRIGDELA